MFEKEEDETKMVNDIFLPFVRQLIVYLRNHGSTADIELF